MSPSGGPAAAATVLLAGLLLLAGSAVLGVGEASAVPPPLPVEIPRHVLEGLGVRTVAPGGTSSLQFQLTNPFGAPLTEVALEFGLYAFNPTPGGGATGLPPASPTLSDGSSSGESLTIDVGTLGVHETGWTTPVSVLVPSGCPSGTFAIRDRISFDLNGTGYLLASIGNFAPSFWQNASVLANGTPTVNLTRLGVSGVLPETAVLVDNSAPLDAALYALLGAAVALGAAGGYLALRRRDGPASRSGASTPPEESQAPTALGNSRKRAGD